MIERLELLSHLMIEFYRLHVWQEQGNTGLLLDQLKTDTFPFAWPEWNSFTAELWASVAGKGERKTLHTGRRLRDHYYYC